MDNVKKQSTTSNMKVSSYLLPVVYIIFSFIFEITQFLYIGFGFLPKYMLFDLAIMVIFAAFVFVAPTNKFKGVLAGFFLLIQLVLNVVNITLYKVFGDIFSFDMLKLGHEVGSVFQFSFLDFKNIILNFVIYGLAITTMVIVCKKNTTVFVAKKQAKLALILAAFVVLNVFGVGFYATSVNSLYSPAKDDPMYIAYSDSYLYTNLNMKLESYKRFGTFGYYAKLINNTFNSPNELTAEKQKELSQTIATNGEYTYVSDKTGLLKDNNVIMILMESFDWYAINPVYTPTLYGIANGGGYSFTNFYGHNKTNVSEGISFLGSLPKTEMMVSYYDSVGISAPYSLPNLMRNDAQNDGVSYEANYFHSWLSSFYARPQTYSELGFETVTCLDDVYKGENLEWGYWKSDEQFVKDCINEFVPLNVDRFFTQFASMSTHGPYDTKNALFKEKLDYVLDNFDTYSEWLNNETDFIMPENKTLLSALQHYLAGTIDLDNTVAYLIDYLEQNNLSDNTSIVLFADHYAYYNDLSAKMKGFGKEDFEEVSVHNIPFMIYSPGLQGTTDVFCSTYDIYPTVCDLFGFNVNKNLAHGNSIFSNDMQDSIFSSHMTGIFTDEMYTTNIVDVTKVVDYDIPPQRVEKFQQNAVDWYARQETVEKVWKNNIFGGK